jgi:hypothetical protein
MTALKRKMVEVEVIRVETLEALEIRDAKVISLDESVTNMRN